MHHHFSLASYKSETAEILVFLRSIVLNLSLRNRNSEFYIKTSLFNISSVFWLAFSSTVKLPAFAIPFGANVLKPKKTFGLAAD